MDKKYEIYYKSGKKEILIREKISVGSAAFNMQLDKLKVGEQLFEMTEGIIIKRID